MPGSGNLLSLRALNNETETTKFINSVTYISAHCQTPRSFEITDIKIQPSVLHTLLVPSYWIKLHSYYQVKCLKREKELKCLQHVYVCIYFFKDERGTWVLKIKIFSTQTQTERITLHMKLVSWTKILETNISMMTSHEIAKNNFLNSLPILGLQFPDEKQKYS